MSVVKSKLSKEQEKKLLSLFDHVRLHLIYKATAHGFGGLPFIARCNRHGPTVCVGYNAAGFAFGGYVTKDYVNVKEITYDENAFLFSISAKREKPLRVTPIKGGPAFGVGSYGPHFGALEFLYGNNPLVLYTPGLCYNFDPAEMHGNDLVLTEFELYRVEDLGDFLPNPWRNIQWTAEKRTQLMRSIQDYKPDNNTVTKVRVLFVGPVGAGKSSFFNSINSAFRGNMTSQAITGTAGTSVTSQFRTYTIKAGRGGGTIPLKLCDTMGLEENPNAGLNTDDIENICKGHIKDRYQFCRTSIKEDSPDYRKHATLNDKIHCLAYVVDTCKVSRLSREMLNKFTAIRTKANELEIPQIVLMTKVDEACPYVSKDLKNVYHSVYVQKKAQQLSESLGIPLSHVLPVKNYCEELELDQTTDILLFMALDQMLNYADSYLENRVHDDEEDELNITNNYNYN